MKKESILSVFGLYLKSKAPGLLRIFLFIMTFIVILFLYRQEMEAILYATFLAGCVIGILELLSFGKFYKKHGQLSQLNDHITMSIDDLPKAKDLLEEDYQRLINTCRKYQKEIISEGDYRQSEMLDYYTMWAHQIKTPIAAMGLLLQTSDNKNQKELQEQLFRIEQYVEMVLGYLRIDSTTSDLYFKYYSLDSIIKQCVRKKAQLFIRKNIRLELEEINSKVLTDEKWLVFVIDQILSNSLKYTEEGQVAIYMGKQEQMTLVIEDTGIGIAEEDLPRIFEKGYTGYNGRMDKKASGIGLYLCKKILKRLSHTIEVQSVVGKGTTVKIDLSTLETIIE
ncbi:sensor histidine kinase [Vallitalea okinawensis]|uniref:sensor histidine kinase n=1 Tax=Vallitalea okinawensis TaxID=2078660 RepID=UPI000CFD00E0|nr:sensor histidine kinase [Vallitalea okinawensis]